MIDLVCLGSSIYRSHPKFILQTSPHYDFEKELPAKLSTEPTRSEATAASNNPDYKPEPLPLTERIPWLIYVVLAASSIALALILISLARTAVRAGSQQTETSA